MRSTKWFSRSILKWTIVKWTLAIGCVAISSLAMESQVYGHHPFRHHHGCFGSYGWGSQYSSGYSSGYSSFYGLSSSYYYPSLSFSYVPQYYSVNYYTPTYFAPVYYPPVYYPPVYYSPAFFPCSTWSGVNFNVGFPVATNNLARNSTVGSFAATNRFNAPLATHTRPFQARTPLASKHVSMQVSSVDPIEQVTQVNESLAKESGVKLVSRKPALLQPYSPIWTKAAVGIVDDMVAAGELEHAHSSCKSMERITQPKGAGVYLRQALLSYFSTDENVAQSGSTDEILQLLELACAAGSQVQPSELAKDSLRDYFSACLVDVNGTMERLSKSVLESPNSSGRELLLLSALLKLDGQPDRARLFANEVGEQVARSGSFHWNSLLEACLN